MGKPNILEFDKRVLNWWTLRDYVWISLWSAIGFTARHLY